MRTLCSAFLIWFAAWAFAPLKDQNAIASGLERHSTADMAILLDAIEQNPELSERAIRAAKYDKILVELVRRGNLEAEGVLEARMKHVEKCFSEVETLTALRRVQHKPDPIVIAVADTDGLLASRASLPALSILVKSADIERVPVLLKMPARNSSNRCGYWRLDVRDSQGSAVPVLMNSDRSRRDGEIPVENEKTPPVQGLGARVAWCEYGASLAYRLPMNEYIEITRPGEYTVTVLYHDKVGFIVVRGVWKSGQ
ncbi:MAG: hypothetical protein HY290_22640 [Planctomycetia bacterium]|nr:hypothetical protein [Planctomycetia bacterium]